MFRLYLVSGLIARTEDASTCAGPFTITCKYGKNLPLTSRHEKVAFSPCNSEQMPQLSLRN